MQALKDLGSAPSAQAAGPLPLATARVHWMAPAIPSRARPPAPPQLPRFSPLIDFIFPRQHGPHRSFPPASGPLLPPPQQQAPLRGPLRLPALPLATHMRTTPPTRVRPQSSECACLQGSARTGAKAPLEPELRRRECSYGIRDWSARARGRCVFLDQGFDWRSHGNGGCGPRGGRKAAVECDRLTLSESFGGIPVP